MRRWIFAFLLIPVLAGYSITKYQVDIRVKERGRSTDIRYLPEPTTARFLSFGFKEAMADFYWIDAINYFGEQLTRKDRSYSYLKPYLELIFNLDPYFTIFYDWAATAFIYNGMPISNEFLSESIRFANRGIKMLHSIGRYDEDLIRKGAFNYALEAQIPYASLDYFSLVGRSFRSQRDMLLVGSSYASVAGLADKGSSLKNEFLSFRTYEANKPEEVREAINILSSPTFNSQAAEFMRLLRIQAEKDEDMRGLVENRLKNHPVLQRAMLSKNQFQVDDRLSKLLQVDISKNWMPPALHLLLDL